MENSNVNLKCRIPLLIISWLAIVVGVLSGIFNVFIVINNYSYFNLYFLHEIFVSILILIPLVFVFLYALKLHKTQKGRNLIAVLYFFIAAVCLYSDLVGKNSLLLCNWLEVFEIVENYQYQMLPLSLYRFIRVTSSFFATLLFVLAGAWQIFSDKKNIIAIVAAIFATIPCLIVLINHLLYIPDVNDRWWYVNSPTTTARPIFHICILMFALLVKPVKVKGANSKTISNNTIAPENELKALKENLEQNLISQEEYDAQRAEIISKL